MNERRWQVILEQQPQKMLRRLPRDMRERVDRVLLALTDNPRPHGCKKLTGHELYRIRVGEWRIIYAVEDDRLIVLVLEIAPRGSAYRDL